MRKTVSLFALSFVLLAAGALASVLNVTQTPLPSGDNVQGGLSTPYMSASYPILWCEGTSNNWWGYDPEQSSFLYTSPMPANTQKDNHINELYYEPTNQMLIGLMELGPKGGVGPYYINGYTANSASLVWGNKSLVVVPGVVGGLGGALSGVVVAIGLNNVAVGIDSADGTVLYTLVQPVAQVRCSHLLAFCVGVTPDSDVFGFDATSGVTR